LESQVPIFSAWKGRRGFGRASSDGPQQQPTMRQVLNALDAGEPVHWIPAGVARAGRKPAPRSRRVLYLAALAVCLTPGGAWLATHPTAKLENGVLAAAIFPRLEQIASTVRSPPEQVTGSAKPDQPLPALVVGDAIVVEAGQRGRLSAHIANSENVQPETVAIVQGLPDDVRLTDGIMIGPGLWMLRSDLLASVQLDPASSASGHHELTLELRTPAGTIVSTGRTMLTIAAAHNEDNSKPSTAVRVADEPMSSQSPSPSQQASRPSRVVVAPVTPGAAPARKPAVKKAAVPTPVIVRPAPVVQERSVVRGKASAGQKVKVVKPVRTAKPAVQSEVTILSAKPSVPQSSQPPRLVWPGDDPRSAPYLSNPPVFLGGFLPGAAPQAKPPARR
jgi:hypothetical protein